MVFSSSIFMFAFLPVFFVLYYLCPTRAAKNTWLLLASLVFYAWGEPVYIVLMVFSIIANWSFGLFIGSADKDSRRKVLLACAIAVDVLIIGFFKYEGFLASNVNALLGVQCIADLNLPLPIGISFYTLQALSYVIDVYRKEVEPQRNLLYLGMYVACFPQLIAGPIVRYQAIQDQVVGRQESLSDFSSGLRLFIVGLAKKALLANTIAILASRMLSLGGASIGMIGAWAGLLAYTFQIYFDFAGYSDMAIGLGRMMGFKYLRNFNYPYISKSITEFWRRWHISLSSFFRDYIYIPLGGSRCSKARWVFNISVVWAITGLWHGADWNYVGWGVYYGVLLICEKLIWGKALAKLPAIVGHVYTIAIFVFGWSFLWITDESVLVEYWKAMVGLFGLTGSSSFWELTAWEYLPVFLVCTIASMPICPVLKELFSAWAEGRESRSVIENGVVNARCLTSESLCVFDINASSNKKKTIVTIVCALYDATLIALLFVSCLSIVSGSFNPFIYFQF